MKDAVLFDLDGTLIDSLPDIAAAMNAALAELGYPTHPLEAYKGFVGWGADRLVRAAAPERAIEPSQFQTIKRLYMSKYGAHCTERTAPYPGVMAGLRALRERGMKLCVVSNKPDPHTKLVTSHYFGYDIFELAAGSEAGYPRKPDPELPLALLASIGSAPERAVFVGDTRIDLDTARNARIDFVGVAWGFQGRAVLEDAGASRVADDISQMTEMIFML